MQHVRVIVIGRQFFFEAVNGIVAVAVGVSYRLKSFDDVDCVIAFVSGKQRRKSAVDIIVAVAAIDR